MSTRPGTPETFDSKVDFICPFCRGSVSAGFDGDGCGGVVHTLPLCEKFEVMEPDDFLTAARIAMTGN